MKLNNASSVKTELKEQLEHLRIENGSTIKITYNEDDLESNCDIVREVGRNRCWVRGYLGEVPVVPSPPSWSGDSLAVPQIIDEQQKQQQPPIDCHSWIEESRTELRSLKEDVLRVLTMSGEEHDRLYGSQELTEEYEKFLDLDRDLSDEEPIGNKRETEIQIRIKSTEISHQVRQPQPVVDPFKEPKPIANQVKQPQPIVHEVKQPQPIVHEVREPQPTVHQVRQSQPIVHQVRQPQPIVQQVRQSQPIVQQVRQPQPTISQVRQPQRDCQLIKSVAVREPSNLTAEANSGSPSHMIVKNNNQYTMSKIPNTSVISLANNNISVCKIKESCQIFMCMINYSFHYPIFHRLIVYLVRLNTKLFPSQDY